MNHKKIRELSDRASSENSLRYRASSAAWHTKVHPVERIQAVEKDQNQVTLDKSGIFVILPKPEKHMILVEHYNNAVNLLGIIAGANSRNIYGSILENVWVTEMSHAANLGKELARSELSIKFGFKYV